MSDITKKIFSIEPVDGEKSREPNASDIIRPVSVKPDTSKKLLHEEKVPNFVTRKEVTPLSSPPAPYIEDEAPRSGWITWTIVGFCLLYLAAAGLFFGMPLLKNAPSVYVTAGLIVLLILPVVLMILLGMSLRQLLALSGQNRNLVKAADLLVSPETEALGRTQTLAGGIRKEISILNSQLADTVEVLQGVQTAVSRESQALDAAGLQLSSRSEDVGRSLTLQRQALESISGTFDARMGTLSAQISETSQGLEAVSLEAETRLSKAGANLTKATVETSGNISAGTDQISERIVELGEISRKLDTTSESLTSDLGASTELLSDLEAQLVTRTEQLDALNVGTQSKIMDLQGTIGFGNILLTELQTAADTRENELKGLYDRLSKQLKKSEDDTLASQGQTARVVEANLAQMRRDFGKMETELQTLQVRLNGLRDTANAMPEPEIRPSRLNLKPLDNDFPPVEPPRAHSVRRTNTIEETPYNLGADMEIETPDTDITDFNPDVISRPGQPVGQKKGFGRKTADKDASGWRWRDMLGGLERPDTTDIHSVVLQQETHVKTPDLVKVDISSRLSEIQLSPSAFVDEGTVIDATQARINNGPSGVAVAVSKRLPDAVAHLRKCMAEDKSLAADIKEFHIEFSKTIGNTPPSAPALRAALGSPDGRAYLLCTAALKE